MANSYTSSAICMDSKATKEMSLFENLKKYFANTSKEQQDKDWKEIEPLNNIGPDVINYIGYQLLQRKIKHILSYHIRIYLFCNSNFYK